MFIQSFVQFIRGLVFWVFLGIPMIQFDGMEHVKKCVDHVCLLFRTKKSSNTIGPRIMDIFSRVAFLAIFPTRMMFSPMTTTTILGHVCIL
jgi:hypothetical protein